MEDLHSAAWCAAHAQLCFHAESMQANMKHAIRRSSVVKELSRTTSLNNEVEVQMACPISHCLLYICMTKKQMHPKVIFALLVTLLSETDLFMHDTCFAVKPLLMYILVFL